MIIWDVSDSLLVVIGVMDDAASLHAFAGQGQAGHVGQWATTDFEGGTRGGTPLVRTNLYVTKSINLSLFWGFVL